MSSISLNPVSAASVQPTNVGVDPAQSIIVKLQEAAKDLEAQEAILNNPNATPNEKLAAAKAAAADLSTININEGIIETNLASPTPNANFVAFAGTQAYIQLFGQDGTGGLFNQAFTLDDGQTVSLADVLATPG